MHCPWSRDGRATFWGGSPQASMHCSVSSRDPTGAKYATSTESVGTTAGGWIRQCAGGRQTDRQTDSSEQTYRRGARRSGGRDAHRRRRRGSSCTGELFIVCVWWLWLATAVAVLPSLLPRVTPVLGMPSPRESSPTTPSSPLRTRALSPSLPLLSLIHISEPTRR